MIHLIKIQQILNQTFVDFVIISNVKVMPVRFIYVFIYLHWSKLKWYATVIFPRAFVTTTFSLVVHTFI